MADTVLGAVFAELLKVVTDVISESIQFQSELEKLKSTVESITPNLLEIERLNIKLKISEQETAELKEELIKGAELVRKCSEVKCCYFKRVYYADKLVKLNQSIEKICKVDMLTQLIRDNKKILEKVEEIGKKIDRDGGVFNRVEIDELCSAPNPAEITPGLITDNKKIMEKVEEIGVNIQTEVITEQKDLGASGRYRG
ncbi:hypothetical protein Ddye_010454 [Dipteronia dyeriana]|uniref:RPW8 domain-containing protein n=1 Tax=Dipteronia dyeriana TaxID=168575 RepID=A0AAE0CN92_9ROSI|nr:hypothetical protein Ddye_010454 [Dipteronia dyeriana]